MFGCLFNLLRLAGILAVLAVIGGGVYYYTRLHPEQAPWRGGVAGVKEKVATATLSVEVKAALSIRGSLKDLDVSVSAERNVITLRGKVPTHELSKEAEEVATSVPGVRQVVNFLEISRAASTKPHGGDDRSMGERVDDEALELKIRAAFRLDKTLSSVAIDVKSMRRSVHLSSATSTTDQMKRALEVARSIDRVVAVTH